MRKTSSILTLAVLATAVSLFAQELWAPKGAPAKYVAPHKPHSKLADLKAKHAGHDDWRELIVNDEHLRGEYVQMRPGAKTPRALHPDTRSWWVVMEGQVRFDVEKNDPFVAARGSMVQAPMQTFFSYEVVGDRPAVLFETNIAGAKTLYERKADAPALEGMTLVPVRFQRTPGVYGRNNKPHVTFDEVARQLDDGKAKGTQRIVEDDRGTANFIYGYEKNLPPINPNDRGHYHPECAEYWLILRGQIRYPIEGVGVIIAGEGDVVYVPKFTFHAPRWYGPDASCRLAMNGYPNIAHLFDAPGTH